MKPVLHCLAALLAASPAFAQGAPAPSTPSFDVASVRPSGANTTAQADVPLDAGNVYGTVSAEDARSAAGGLFLATRQPLWRYITFAYKLSGTQEISLRFNLFSGAPKSGAPFWVTGSFTAEPEYFDITARAPSDTSIDQMRLMMQTLLADRFHLAVHYTTADAPVFALVLNKPELTGPQLRPHPPSDACGVAASHTDHLPPHCGVIAHVASSEPGLHYGGRAIPLSLLATSIPTMTGIAATPRPVVDQTGLAGLYDFTISWVHDRTADDAAVSDNVSSFRDALKTQLGLALRPTRAPVSFLVVDHVVRASAN